MSSFNILVNLAEKYSLKKGLTFFSEFYNSKKNEDSGNLTNHFLQLFPSLTNEFVKELKIASNLYFFSVLAVDKLIDEENIFDKEALLLAIALRENGIHRMYQIIEPSNRYWIYFEEYYKQYINALSIEQKNHSGKITDLNIKELELLYSGKSAMAKALPTAMAFQDGNEKVIVIIEKSINYYYIALNLYDDVNDWKQDWNNGNFSYLITKTIVNNNLNPLELSIEQLGHYVFFKNEALSCLELSLDYFIKAERALEYTESSNWKLIIKSKFDTCKNLKEDIEMLISKQLIIAGIKKGKKNDLLPIIKVDSISNIQHVTLINGLKYILNQWENGFSEVTIHSYFPNADGFIFNHRYYEGDVFQRSIIADIMFDLNIELDNCLTPFIEFETNYLISQERSKGGWNFYKNLEYQPNDSDTTAQVLQVLIKMNKQNHVCQNTIKVIDEMLEQQLVENGRIRTWFLPTREKQNIEEQKQYKFIKYYAGNNLDESIDLDVMANFLYSLVLLNKEKYVNPIRNGIDFLEKQQNEDGSWTSTWYWGNYYSTYISLKLLSEAKKDSETIVKAKDFLLNKNSKQKYWGNRSEIDDPLNTAYALISLYYISELNLEVPEQKIREACNYLKYAIGNFEELQKSDYINLRKKEYSSFRSNSITIAYSLKALSLWKSLNN